MPGYVYLDLPRSEMVPYVPVGAGHVLDVGCGLGGFGKALKERGPVSVTGIEADADAAATAATRYDRLINGYFPGDVPPGDRFDCIVFNDILEHLVDPWGAVEAARGMLRPEGLVIASIPNMRYWPVFWRLVRRGEWNYVSDGVLDRTHLRFFTRGSIRLMFEGAGFAIRALDPINPIDLADLEPSGRRMLALVRRFRPHVEQELRAQQFAVVAA